MGWGCGPSAAQEGKAMPSKIVKPMGAPIEPSLKPVVEDIARLRAELVALVRGVCK